MPSFHPSKWSSDQHKGWITSRGSDHGLTRSQMGAGGGALLARPADRITLLDVLRAVGLSGYQSVLQGGL
ncbi:Rrf2 family transcriptional regulator [Phenylobacterium sp. VNQ135]|uniref:Rrf2 family transcriptional regulator n=1 Tax=Phenylobacterium sp. VNQ135 TaxID=3400922 RepID=UPI003C0F6B11